MVHELNGVLCLALVQAEYLVEQATSFDIDASFREPLHELLGRLEHAGTLANQLQGTLRHCYVVPGRIGGAPG
jgi:hypothetical protein